MDQGTKGDRSSVYTMDRFFKVLRQQSSTPSVHSAKNPGKSQGKQRWSKSIKKKIPSSIVKGRDSLLEIIYSHRTEELEKILASGVEFRALDPEGVVLIKAVELGYTDMVASLVRGDVSVHDTGQGHVTPLHAAARLGFAGIAAVLISNGARVNEPSKYERSTPLHLAVLENFPTLVDLLLSNGADVSLPDIYGQTPLHVAARGGASALVRRLLEAGALVGEMTKDGWTALHLAAAGGHVDVVKVLVEHNAPVDAQTKFGCTALHWACKQRQNKVVIALVDAGSNLKIRDSNGRTAAECSDSSEIKRYLTTVQRNRKSIYFTAQPINRLSIELQRSSSPFAHIHDTTLSPTGRHMYTSYEDAISQNSASSPELSQPKHESSILENSRDSIFLEVPQVTFHRTRKDTDESISGASAGSGRSSDIKIEADVHEEKNGEDIGLVGTGKLNLKATKETQNPKTRQSPQTERGTTTTESGFSQTDSPKPNTDRSDANPERDGQETNKSDIVAKTDHCQNTQTDDVMIPLEAAVFATAQSTRQQRYRSQAKDSEVDRREDGLDGRKENGLDGVKDNGYDGRKDNGVDGGTESGLNGRKEKGSDGRRDTGLNGRRDTVLNGRKDNGLDVREESVSDGRIDSELDGGKDKVLDEANDENGLHHRSQSVPFIPMAKTHAPQKELKADLDTRERAATMGNIFQLRNARSKPESELLHVKLFSMINRVNKSISDLEHKVSRLQLADSFSFLGTSFENSEEDYDDDDDDDDESAKDTDSAYEQTETDDVTTPCSSDVTIGSGDVMARSKSEVMPPSVVLDHQPSDANVMSNSDVMSISCNGDLSTKPTKQRVYKRKSLPIKNSYTKSATIGTRIKRNTECENREDDAMSVGSSVSLKSDIQDVQDKLTGLKHTFMSESEQIARLLIAMEEE